MVPVTWPLACGINSTQCTTAKRLVKRPHGDTQSQTKNINLPSERNEGVYARGAFEVGAYGRKASTRGKCASAISKPHVNGIARGLSRSSMSCIIAILLPSRVLSLPFSLSLSHPCHPIFLSPVGFSLSLACASLSISRSLSLSRSLSFFLSPSLRRGNHTLLAAALYIHTARGRSEWAEMET